MSSTRSRNRFARKCAAASALAAFGCGAHDAPAGPAGSDGALLVEIATVPRGEIVDVSGNRVLYVADSTIDPIGGQRRMTVWRQTIGAAPESLFRMTGYWIPYLTSHGAVVLDGPVDGTFHLREWRDGTLLDPTQGNVRHEMAVKGDYALWRVEPVDGFMGNLYRRHFASGTTDLIAQIAPDNDPYGMAAGLAANGDVVWVLGDALHRLHDGRETMMADDGALGQSGFGTPVTDGINVAAKLGMKFPFGLLPPSVAWANGQQIALGVQGVGPLLNNGWMAYWVVTPPSPFVHIWTRAPDGTVRLVDQLQGPPVTNALGADGTVVFSNQDAAPRQYVSVPPYTTMTELGPPSRAIERDGHLILLRGRTAYRINPPR